MSSLVKYKKNFNFENLWKIVYNYRNIILKENLLPFIDELNQEMNDDDKYIFQEDNAPCHTAQIAKNGKMTITSLACSKSRPQSNWKSAL